MLRKVNLTLKEDLEKGYEQILVCKQLVPFCCEYLGAASLPYVYDVIINTPNP